jgi:putative ATP-dependent endonuclease of OLD family
MVLAKLEQITGKRKPRASGFHSEPPPSFGSAAHKIGVLLLVGALLRSGTARGGQSIAPLTLIENPEAHLHPMTLASIWGVIDRISGQKIIATHSGTLLACARLSSVRRLTRHAGRSRRARARGSLRRRTAPLLVSLAKPESCRQLCPAWFLVEGETEFWLMSELARLRLRFRSEGAACGVRAMWLGCTLESRPVPWS